jgi:hypothetical protein
MLTVCALRTDAAVQLLQQINMQTMRRVQVVALLSRSTFACTTKYAGFACTIYTRYAACLLMVFGACGLPGVFNSLCSTAVHRMCLCLCHALGLTVVVFQKVVPV